MIGDEQANCSMYVHYVTIDAKLTTYVLQPDEANQARRDEGYKSGKLMLTTILDPRPSSVRNMALSLNLLSMMMHTDDPATYSDSSF
jgi:hypothetical protein